MRKTPRIVIVGGGIAGLLLATKLGNTLGRDGRAEITLVDKSATHIWKPMLHTIAAGTRDVQQQQVIYLAHARAHGFAYQPGELESIDQAARVIQLAPLRASADKFVIGARKINYDVLILALGSRANDFGTPGVLDHCHFIDSQAQAEVFNEALRIRIFQSVVADTSFNVSIVGGGATGVELAAELSRLLEIASSYGDSSVRSRLNLTLYESGPRLLAAFPEAISASSEAVLQRIGFTIKTGTRVLAAEENGLKLSDPDIKPADLMVWAAGVKAPEFLKNLPGVEVNRSNQIIVKPTLQTQNDDNIFALGDCSSLTLQDQQRPLAPTAQVATQQAKHLAKHLPSWLENRNSTLPDFVFHDLGALVSLSDYNAFGTLGKYGLFNGGFIKGRFAQLSHAMLYRQHQQALHGFGKATLLWTAERVNGLVQPKIRLS